MLKGEGVEFVKVSRVSRHKLWRGSIVFSLVISLLMFNQFYVRAVDEDSVSGWALEEFNEAKTLELVLEEADHDYKSYISRELFCSLIVNMVEKRMDSEIVLTISNPFTDTDEISIIKAYQLGIVNGTSATSFSPNDPITREQIAAMMVRAAKKMDVLTTKALTTVINTESFSFGDMEDISGWALNEVKEANALGILNGIGENLIGPKGKATVEQSISLILRLHNANKTAEMGQVLSNTNLRPVSKAVPPGGFLDFDMMEQTSITLNADQLATDPNGDALTIVSALTTSSSPYGTVGVTTSGEVTYTAGNIASSPSAVRDPVLVMVSDGLLETPVVFSLIIEADPNDPPVELDLGPGVFKDFDVHEQVSITIVPTQIATDPNGDVMTIVSAQMSRTNPYGTIVVNPNGSVTYTSGDILNDTHVVSDPVVVYVSDGIDQAPAVFSLVIEPDVTPPTLSVNVSHITFEMSKKEVRIITIDDIIAQGLTSDPRITLNRPDLRMTSIVSQEYGRITPASGGQSFVYQPDDTITTDLYDLVIVSFSVKNPVQNDYIHFDIPVYFDVSAF